MLALYAFNVILLAFLGILVAILLRAPADWLSEHTRLSSGWALTLVCLVALVLLVAAIGVFGRGLAVQTLDLADRLPQIIESAKEALRSTEAGARVLELAEGSGALQGGESQLAGRGAGVVGMSLGAIAHTLLVIFFALFLAASPQLYVRGLLHLVPPARRDRARDVLHEIGHVLRRWLVGQSLLALSVGLLTGIGLWLIGAPLALPLALLAGLMEFVPYIGPFVATVPAIMVALSEGAQMALWVAALYLVVQVGESYVLAPLVQHKAVHLAPALILFAQVLMGVLAGGLGVALATPLAAALLVAVRMLYVEDALGDKSAA